MISKEDRMYYIDPLQPAQVRKNKADGTELPLRIVALRYRRDTHKQENIGSIVEVTHQRVENNELWWVDTDGDYVYGAQLCDRVQGRGAIMSIVNDDLFYVGQHGGEHHLGSSQYGTLMTSAVRSDGKVFRSSNEATSFTYVSSAVFKAASWARGLMPAEGDTEEVVTAKVARAKQLFVQRHKKGEIYKEGMRRDWLHHLEGLRADHDMPTPVFNVGIEGTFLTTSSGNVPLAELEPHQRDRIAPVSRNSIIHTSSNLSEDHAQTFVGRPFVVVTGQTANNLDGVMSVRQGDIRYSVFDSLRVSSGHILESSRFPILTSF